MELLVVVDPLAVQGDEALQAARFVAGNVVVARPDGHAWSEWERTDKRHRIIQVDITQAEADLLTAPQIGDPAQGPLHRLAYRIDISSPGLPGLVRAALASGNRVHAVFNARAHINGPDFMARKVAAPAQQQATAFTRRG